MVADEVDDRETNASLARLRLFLSSHAPNGSVEPKSSPPKRFSKATASEKTIDTSDLKASHDHSELTAEKSYAEIFIDNDEDEAGQTTIPAAGAAASVAPLSPLSKDFARVKYLLQCSLPGYRVHEEVVIWDMRNPLLIAQYEQHTTGLLELESWVAVNDLGADMGDVHRYGFTSLEANQSSMKFTTGNVQLGVPPPESPAQANKKASSTRQLVLCKIAVGRSLVINNEREAHEPLPPGYHSYYLHREEEETTGQDHGPPTIPAPLLDRGYYHEYILNNTIQVLPQYLVRFTFSAADAQGHAVGPCALCEQRPAVVLCRNCDAEICACCDHEVHSANKLVRRHKRTPLRSRVHALGSGGVRRGRRRSSTPTVVAASAEIDTDDQLTSLHSPARAEATDSQLHETVAKLMEDNMQLNDAQIPMCRTHYDKKVEFYCPLCQSPVCVSCKMVGDHSSGEKGAHRLLPLAEAYESCLRESLRPDPVISSRKAVIENKLQFLTRLQTSVHENQAQVARDINEQCARALRCLDQAVAIKMRVLAGESLEYERQLQQIDWVDESLEDHRMLLPAVEFLAAWNQHKLLRAEQRDFPPFAHDSRHSAEQVKPDLQVAGELRVLAVEERTNAYAMDENIIRNQCGPMDESQIDLQAAPRRGRSSDSEMRTRLLSMKAALPLNPNAEVFMASRRAVSLKCQQVLDEIRHETLLQDNEPKDAVGPQPDGRSRYGLTNRLADSTATLRAFSVQPMVLATNEKLRSPHHRRGTKAWSTLLRREMGPSE